MPFWHRIVIAVAVFLVVSFLARAVDWWPVRRPLPPEAATRYRVLRVFKDVAALVECRLATGRTHQIRVHLAERGHPLIGDPIYGRSRGRKRALPEPVRAALEQFPRQALHATQLGFDHPISAQHLDFKDDIPSDMSELVRILEAL